MYVSSLQSNLSAMVETSQLVSPVVSGWGPHALTRFFFFKKSLELRTRGSLSGSCDVLNTLLSCCQPKDIDPRKYVFRMFATIKSADKRYAEYVNCALWIGTGVWKGDELLVE